jgi:hypothetical protein
MLDMPEGASHAAAVEVNARSTRSTVYTRLLSNQVDM